MIIRPVYRTIALAAAAMSVSAASQAQSSLNIFGVMDMAVGSFQISGTPGSVDNTRITKVESGQMVTSQIGFRGMEDLGGGLKAGFSLISFFRADTGAAGRIPGAKADEFWGKAANVYLDSPYGKVTLGRQTDLVFLNVLSYNPFVDSFGLSPAVRLTFGRWGNDKGDSGVSNAITYQSPKMSGLTVAVQYQAGEKNALNSAGVPNTDPGDSYAVSFTFTDGAFSTSASLQKLQSAEAPKADFAAGQSQSFGMLSASYDFGVAKLFGQFGEIKNDGFTPAGNAPKKTNIYLIGSTVPVTPMGKVLVSYGQSKEKTPDMKHSIFTLAYDHFLSKRTDIYAAYMLDDEKSSTAKKGNSYVLGVKHVF